MYVFGCLLFSIFFFYEVSKFSIMRIYSVHSQRILFYIEYIWENGQNETECNGKSLSLTFLSVMSYVYLNSNIER